MAEGLEMVRGQGGSEAASYSPALARSDANRGWIISPAEDLLWFQGSVLFGLGLLALFAAVGPLTNESYRVLHPAVLVLVLWGVFFDGTHVFATYARTYFVNDPVSRSGLPANWTSAIILVGPILAIIDYFIFAPGPSLLGQAGILFRLFLLFAYLWAYWHLIRQHYGFLVLYQRKAGVTRRLGRLEVWALWIGCMYPYLRFALSPAYAASGMVQTVPAALLPSLTRLLDAGFLGVMLVLVALIVARREPGPTAPRWLFLGIVIGFHVLVFRVLDNLLTITATITIFHNLQYHRIVWQYERGHSRVPAGSLARYLGLGIALGLVWYLPRILGVAAAGTSLLRNVLMGLGWGVAFHHYLVDGRIWRVRRTQGVARALDAGAA